MEEERSLDQKKGEERLLDKIIEECAEVTHVACKWKRFGGLDYHPEDILQIPNYQLLLNEMQDAETAFNTLRAEIRAAIG
jgi:hypothetical protein